MSYQDSLVALELTIKKIYNFDSVTDHAIDSQSATSGLAIFAECTTGATLVPVDDCKVLLPVSPCFHGRSR